MEKERNYFFRDLIVKILIVLLFVFLLMWLLPMPNMAPLYDKIFSQNISSMTDAAKSYYTTARLPQEEGETKKLTLRDMLNNKMIIEFTDSNGKTCNADKSYVEVTKQNGEYIFKTNLSCGNEEDYVIEYFGCYDVCEDGKCETKIEENDKKDVIEYEFYKKTTSSYISKYVCPSGYTLNGNKCVSGNTKEVNANLKCINGYTYNDDTKMCEKVVSETIDATKTCPSGYEMQGNTCVKGSENVVDAKVTYVCDNGILIGNKCYITDTKVVDARMEYICHEGVLSGNKCVISSIKEVNATKEYYCESGKLYGNKCYTSETKPVTSTVSYTCPSGGSLEGTKCVVSIPQTCSEQQVCSNRTYSSSVGTTSTGSSTGRYLYQTPSGGVYEVCTTTYSCSGGGSYSYDATATYTCSEGTLDLNGTTCTVLTRDELPAKVKYTCSEGTLSGDKCLVNTSTTKDASKMYICDEGTLNNDNTCTIAKRSEIDANIKYVCDAGKLDGNKCVISGINTTDTVYTCTYGTLNNDKCEIRKTDTQNPTYYCEAGFNQIGNKCYSNDTKTIDATAVTGTKTDTIYKWSTKETLEGWTRTGRTRTSGVSVTSRY